MSVRQGLVSSFVVVIALAVTGCTATQGPVATDAAGPSSTPSPTPTYQQPAAPVSRLGIDCATLAAMPEFAAYFGTPPVQVSLRQGLSSGSSSSTHEVAFLPILQAGGFDCAFSDRTDAQGPVEVVTITAVPGIEASSWPTAPPEGLPLVQTAGWADDAYVGCYSLEGLNCRYRVLIGTTWLEITNYTIEGTAAALQTRADPLARAVVAQVVAAGEPLPQWQPTDHGDALSCDQLIPAGTSVAPVGALTFDATPGSIIGPLADEAMRLVGGVECTWNGTGGFVRVINVPGGAWSWAPHPPASNVSLTINPLAGVGDAATLGCSAIIDDCNLQTIVGGDRVAIQLAGRDSIANSDAVALAQAVLARR